MPLRSSVRTFDTLPHLTERMLEKTRLAVNAAAEAGQGVADERAQGVTEFSVIPARDVGEGIAAGILAKNPIFRVFDKGSLGKRTAKLKRPNLRKESWRVERRGAVYEAHRGDVEGKGVAARQITGPARLAGRRALIERIHKL